MLVMEQTGNVKAKGKIRVLKLNRETLRVLDAGELKPPATPHPFFGFNLMSGPPPTSEPTSLSVGNTQVTEPPTLTRPFVCAAAGTVPTARIARTQRIRFM